MAVLAALFPVNALGEPSCTSHKEALEQLQQKYNETPIVLGISKGSVLEILASPNGETWTALFVDTNGQACFAASGVYLEILTKGGKGTKISIIR